MIIKHFELQKKDLKKFQFFLLYGNNQGHVEETINDVLKPILPKNIYVYEESEIIKDINILKENIFNKSFFENQKLIIINRVSDKSFKIFEEIVSDKINDVFLILISKSLDKRSKLRKLFETDKQTVCVPFYEDNFQQLAEMVHKFVKEKNINVSQQMINVIVDRAKGDRNNLKNELSKIENFMLGKKNIEMEEILKITNLSENYDISELVDSCLSKNNNKIKKILNENNFSSDECILIIRTFLNKLKRISKLNEIINTDKSTIEEAISLYKPPIFWKEKEVVKQQLKFLNSSKTQDLIYKANEIELLIKKRPETSINVTTDFVVSQNI